MSKIKVFNKSLNAWVIAGSDNANNIELDNETFLENGKPISVSDGFSKVDKRVTTLEQNLAWIYNNGAKGGGGGSGSDSVTYQINFQTGTKTTYYINSGSSITLPVQLTGGSKANVSFTLYALDQDSNVLAQMSIKTLDSYKDFVIPNITTSTKLRIYAANSSSTSLDAPTITVYVASLALVWQRKPTVKIINNTLNGTFRVDSQAGSVVKLSYVCGDNKVEETRTLATSYLQITRDFSDVVPNISGSYTITISAQMTIDTETITATPITAVVNVVDSDSLSIIIDGISSSSTTPTVINQGATLSFSYYLSYGHSDYTTFVFSYKVKEATTGTYLNNGNDVYSTTSRSNVELNTFYSTTTLEQDKSYIIEFKAASKDNVLSATSTNYIKVSATTAQELSTQKNSDLLMWFNPYFTGNSVNNTWTPYTHPQYNNSLFSGIDTTMRLYNDAKTDIVSDNAYSSALILNGTSYATIEGFKNFFSYSSFFSNLFSYGFDLSITYKLNDSASDDAYVLCWGKYDSNNDLLNGIEITSNYVKLNLQNDVVTVTNASIKVPKNKIITVDIQGQFEEDSYTQTYYYALIICLNGVVSVCRKFIITKPSQLYWMDNSVLYLNCKNTNGTLSNYGNVNIYDFKMYTKYQTFPAIVYNYIIATEYAQLSGANQVDSTIKEELESKNLIYNGRSLLCSSDSTDSAGNIVSGATTLASDSELLSNILSARQSGIPYDVVVVTMTDTQALCDEFYSVIKKSWKDTEAAKKQLSKTKYKCKIEFYPKQSSEAQIVIANDDTGINIQGTSTLAYNGKNFEYYLGSVSVTAEDGTVNSIPMLFQAKTDWMPENEFTSKADIADSAHVNNVFIGNIINGDGVARVNGSKTKVPVFNSNVGRDETSFPNQIKRSTTGFPILLFLVFPVYDKTTNITVNKTEFQGIHNFNLGRYAFYNLGMRKMNSYTAPNKVPGLVTEYSYTEYPQMYGFEVQENDSEYRNFSQGQRTVLEYMFNTPVYPQDTSRREEAFTALGTAVNVLANMTKTPVPIVEYDSTLGKYTQTGKNYTYNSLTYTYDIFNATIDWDTACKYFVLCILFGMTDSINKNLTLRTWNKILWYLCYYDMDDALGLNNRSAEAITYDAHINLYLNATSDGVTQSIVTPIDASSAGQAQYGVYYSRLWALVDPDNPASIPNVDTGNFKTKTARDIYNELRNNLIKDPEQFITDNCLDYIDQCGSLLYDLDYKIKYVDFTVSDKLVTSGDTSVNTSTEESTFLHGNRKYFILDWFKKRVNFLDSVYGYKFNPSLVKDGDWSSIQIDLSNTKVYNQWSSNFVIKPGGGQQEITVQATQKTRVSYANGQSTPVTFWASETPSKVTLPMPSGYMASSVINTDFLTQFSWFQTVLFQNLTTATFPNLKSIYLQQNSINNAEIKAFFTDNLLCTEDGTGLKNIETVDFSNLQLADGLSTGLSAAYCYKLKSVNISGSDITAFTLPNKYSVVKYLDYSNTKIKTLTLTDQTSLETLILSDCIDLTSITLSGCTKLNKLVLPSALVSLNLSGCDSLSDLKITYSSTGTYVSPLLNINLDSCPGILNIELTGQNNPNAVFNLKGAYNLQSLILSYVKDVTIQLPDTSIWTSLKSLDLSNSKIKLLTIGTTTVSDTLDLTAFTKLSSISLTEESSIISVNCNSTTNVTLSSNAFKNCTNLTTITGHFTITGNSVFEGCSKFNIIVNSNTNIPDNLILDFNITDATYLFKGCQLFTAFAYIIKQIENCKINNANGMFYNCSSISAALPSNFFSGAFSYLRNMKEMFYNSGISGEITKSLFTPLTQISNMESAFYGTKINKLWNDAFDSINSILQYADMMFAECGELVGAQLVDGNEVKYLSCDTFFSQFTNLVNGVFPSEMFLDCQKLVMNFNTYLFHSKNSAVQTKFTKINNTLYAGVTLTGTLSDKIFQPDNVVINGTTYYQPQNISSIYKPFSYCNVTNELKFSFPDMANIFKGLTSLQIASYVFQNCYCTDSTIPSNIFNINNGAANNLNNISGFFSEINNFAYSGQFPLTDMFKYTTSLANISQLFAGNIDSSVYLVGEEFKNCILSDVSGIFQNSGVYGTIPFHFFYMTDGTNIRQTITTMTNMFLNCYKLGYDNTRTIKTGDKIAGGNHILSWSDHIILNPGNKVWYTVNPDNYSNTEKAWAIDGYTVNSLYTDTLMVDDTTQANTYSSTYELDDSNRYNQPGFQHYAFPADLFRYCSAACTLEKALNGFTYKVQKLVKNAGDTDEDRTISTNATTSISETIRGTTTVNTVSYAYDGLVGRIPAKVFDALTANTSLIGVFMGTHFSPYINMDVNVSSDNIVRTLGWKYPFGLLDNNVNLTNITQMFAETEIEVGVQIDTNMFEKCTKLNNISGLWKNVKFHNERDLKTALGSVDGNNATLDRTGRYPFVNKAGTTGVDIPFISCCKYLENISDLFGVSSASNIEGYGLQYFAIGTSDILWFSKQTINNVAISYPAISNISEMFANNTILKSITSPFTSIDVSQIISSSNYFTNNISKTVVTNEADVKAPLRPTSWDN